MSNATNARTPQMHARRHQMHAKRFQQTNNTQAKQQSQCNKCTNTTHAHNAHTHTQCTHARLTAGQLFLIFLYTPGWMTWMTYETVHGAPAHRAPLILPQPTVGAMTSWSRGCAAILRMNDCLLHVKKKFGGLCLGLCLSSLSIPLERPNNYCGDHRRSRVLASASSVTMRIERVNGRIEIDLWLKGVAVQTYRP